MFRDNSSATQTLSIFQRLNSEPSNKHVLMKQTIENKRINIPQYSASKEETDHTPTLA